MGYIIKKMGYQAPHGFLGLNVLLTANVAKPAQDLGIAIKAYLLFAFLEMRQCKIFPKIVKPFDFGAPDPV